MSYKGKSIQKEIDPKNSEGIGSIEQEGAACQGDNFGSENIHELLPCIFGTSICEEKIQVEDYVSHLHKHNLQPVTNESKFLTSHLITCEELRVSPDEFKIGKVTENNANKQIKWIHTWSQHFIFMSKQLESNVWMYWMYMITGDETILNKYIVKLYFFKNGKCMGGYYRVQPIWKSIQDIKSNGNCILVDDSTMEELSGVKANDLLFTDIGLCIEVIPTQENHYGNYLLPSRYKSSNASLDDKSNYVKIAPFSEGFTELAEEEDESVARAILQGNSRNMEKA